jgi:hypothetical protein
MPAIATTAAADWAPSKAEVDAIVAEMRPIIDRICARDEERCRHHN